MSIELNAILVELLQSVFSVHSLKIKKKIIEKDMGRGGTQCRKLEIVVGFPVAGIFS